VLIFIIKEAADMLGFNSSSRSTYWRTCADGASCNPPEAFFAASVTSGVTPEELDTSPFISAWTGPRGNTALSPPPPLLLLLLLLLLRSPIGTVGAAAAEWFRCTEGTSEGVVVGSLVGWKLGTGVGRLLGTSVGNVVFDGLGDLVVGMAVGVEVGASVGRADGVVVGSTEGI
jgi:hypothetical protein